MAPHDDQFLTWLGLDSKTREARGQEDQPGLAEPDFPAAGTPHAVFCTTPEELVRITGGEVIDVKEDS